MVASRGKKSLILFVCFVSMNGSLESVSMASDLKSEEDLDKALENMTVEGKLSISTTLSD